MRLAEWLRAAGERFDAAGLASAPVEARRIAESVLARTPAQLVLSAGQLLTANELASLDRLLERRLRHEPLQYLVRRAAFRNLDLEVGPGVFIPRPETEGLVELVLPLLRGIARHRPPRFLELCTGSGAILAALLTECPPARGIGVELSSSALAYARRNVEAAGVSSRAELLEGNLYRPLEEARVERGFDLIVANPPYIPGAALAGLPAEVRVFEPRLALDGGMDGTVVIERIVRDAPAWLAPGGGLALEIDESHGERVLGLCARAGLDEARLLPDAAGRVRYSLASRGGS